MELQINVVSIVLIFSSFSLFIGILSQKQEVNSLSLKSGSKQAVKCSPNGAQCRNLVTNETWYLAWHDEFNYWDRKDLYEHWTVEDSVKPNCKRVLQISCNSDDNVEVSNGKLFLNAKYDAERGQFTSAAVNSVQMFHEGRYEIRAQLPVENGVRVSILTKGPQETYWHQTGQLDIMSYIQTQTIYRTVHTQKRKAAVDNLVVDFNAGLSNSHLYGVEWNQTRARFFFDYTYGQVFSVPPGQFLNPQQQIRMQISVGGIYFPTEPECESLHNCNQIIADPDMQSQFVIDYVRVYKK